MEAATTSERGDRARYGREVKTLREAQHQFLRHGAAWLMLAAIAILGAARIAVGDFGWGDAVAVAAMLIVYPFGEWAIHVFLLHMKPFQFRGKKVQPFAARAHRAHHNDPGNLD